jgi:alpha-L-glutamate ligase-like protein
MNARYKYTKFNSTKSKSYGFSKLRTKELLNSHDIPTAQVYHVFTSLQDLDEVNWEIIPAPFVVKPASGSAGKGIIVITKKLPNQSKWVSSDNEHLTDEDLTLHVSNILDGEFSTWGSSHKAIVEEMIPSHPALLKYSYRGTPDIRVIVFNSVPIMAMARIPTKESQGRANLDKGAIALGIDLATGISTYGLYGKSSQITRFPHNNKKVNGIMIPEWTKVLTTAVEAANAAGYVFMGADIFVHPEKGPMIVELNGYPGLSIQLANRAGLKRRLERVEGLDVRDAKHGVKIAQALFAEHFSDNIRAESGLTIIPMQPTVTVIGDRKKNKTVPGLINTGRSRSAISMKLAEELGLLDFDDLLWQQKEVEGKVPVVEVQYSIKNTKHKTAMVVTRRLDRAKYKVELGRRDTSGFLIGETE